MQREQEFTNTDIKVNKKLERDYFKLSIEQWEYGNAAIIQEMVENHELDDQGVQDYLEYTKYINPLFSKYVKGVFFCSTANIVKYNSRRSSDGEYHAHISRIFS